jgi:hypothetical protein
MVGKLAAYIQQDSVQANGLGDIQFSRTIIDKERRLANGRPIGRPPAEAFDSPRRSL